MDENMEWQIQDTKFNFIAELSIVYYFMSIEYVIICLKKNKKESIFYSYCIQLKAIETLTT